MTTRTLDERIATPRCPGCGWHLRFVARDYSWIARCVNAVCAVDEVPPRLNHALIDFLRGGEKTAEEVAAHFGWTQSNSNNHLQELLRLAIIIRRSCPPKRGGKRFVWRLAAGSQYERTPNDE